MSIGQPSHAHAVSNARHLVQGILGPGIVPPGEFRSRTSPSAWRLNTRKGLISRQKPQSRIYVVSKTGKSALCTG